MPGQRECHANGFSMLSWTDNRWSNTKYRGEWCYQGINLHDNRDGKKSTSQIILQYAWHYYKDYNTNKHIQMLTLTMYILFCVFKEQRSHAGLAYVYLWNTSYTY